MTEWIEVLLGETAPGPMLYWLADAALKGLLVLAAATAGCVILRRSSASLKHLCWSLALAAALAVPLLSLIIPAVPIELLPARATAPPIAWAGAAAESTPSVVNDDLLSFGLFEDGTSASAPAADVPAKAPAPAADVPAKAPAPAADVPAKAPAPAADASAAASSGATEITASSGASEVPLGSSGATEVPPTAWAGASWPVWLVAGWGVGATVVLLYMLVGMLAVRRLVRRAAEIQDAEWLALGDEMAERMSVRRPVRLLRSTDVGVPMTWGVTSPVILLPVEASQWPAERRRCVLAHELAHVRRGDCITQAMATAACAVHWFNPLAWRAARAMRLEREKACDDAVLRTALTKASAYATHLLDIARRAPAAFAPPGAALMMARRTQLEGRVMAILDEGRRRRLHRPMAGASILVVGLLVLSLAAVRAAPATDAHSVPLAVTVESAAGDKLTFPDSKPAVDDSKWSVTDTSGSIQDVVKRSFDVSPNGWLRVDTDGGNIKVRTSSRNRVDVEVHRRARGRASEEDFRVEFNQDGDEIEIVGEHVRHRQWGRDGVSAELIITVPRRFNLDLETAGGNISIEDLDGTAEVQTAGGNLSFGNISGSVDAHTSGGNVSIDGSSGDVQVSTSGGNISLGRIGGTVDVQTSGGNISVDEVHGQIEAETSGGTIVARLVDQPGGDSVLKTSGGTVTIYLAEDISLDLDAETSAGRVVTDIEVTVEGELRKDRLRGTINGGGPELRLDTSAGDIHIRKL